MTKSVRFYFSFRSPYSWLATYRITRILEKLPVSFELIPVFPPKDYKNDPEGMPLKSNYIKGDVERIAHAYGLTIKWPQVFDTNWMRPHATFLYAQDQGKGLTYSLAMHSARFCSGQDLGDVEVIKNLATKVDLDPQVTAAATDDRKFHKRILQGLSQANNDKIFGVPTFVYGDQIYWGNDRIEWLLRDIYRDAGKSVPDLGNDPFARPF
jgi:2-hydroxychromene-2-carboxylate isomerase